jgi:uncharacterized membrane protein
MANEPTELKFESVMTTIGAILIGCGLIWFVYRQWDYMAGTVKMLIFLIATIAAYYFGNKLKTKGYAKSSEALFFLGAILWTSTMFVMINIAHISLKEQSLAWILFAALAGTTIMAYALESYSSIFASLVIFLAWISAQFIALSSPVNGGMITVLFLLCGILFYGLSLWHERLTIFSRFYKIWTIIYILLCGHIFTYQVALQGLWRNNDITAGGIAFLAALAIVAISLTITGVYRKKIENAIEQREIAGATAVIGLMIVMILLSLITKTDSNNYGTKNLGTIFYLIWILINILYIGLIILLAEYGVWTKNNAIINNCFLAFIITIVARYIGFIMDYGGYLGFAVVSIIGGVIIIFGGIYIEKWRRKVLVEANTTNTDAIKPATVSRPNTRRTNR